MRMEACMVKDIIEDKRKTYIIIGVAFSLALLIGGVFTYNKVDAFISSNQPTEVQLNDADVEKAFDVIQEEINYQDMDSFTYFGAFEQNDFIVIELHDGSVVNHLFALDSELNEVVRSGTTSNW